MRRIIGTTFVAASALALTACGGEASEVEGEAAELTGDEAASDAGGDANTDKPMAEGDAEAVAGKPDADGDDGAKSDIDFGDDSSRWANDDECDDPRFQGPGMTATPLLDDDIRHDATDCREAYERGELTLR